MSDTSTINSIPTGHSTMSKKKIGLLTMMATCIGMVIVQGAMISAMQGIGLGGMGFIFAMLAALIIAQFNAMSFSELSLMFPQEGTLATYTQKAIGHFPAIVSVFAGYVVVATLALPVELFLVDAMVGQLLPGMFPEKLIPILIVAILAITNIIGTDVFSKVQNVLAFVMVSALILTALAAVSGSTEPHPILTGATVDWGFSGVTNGSFIGLIALAMWLFVGSEYICPMINEVKNPEKNIPKAMRLSLLAIFCIFALFVYGASLYLNTDELLKSPIPYLNYANAVFGKAGLIIATIMALTATCSTVNTIFAALPRMLHGMAQDKQAFPILKVTNRFGSPWVGIVMMAVLVIIPFLVMTIDSLIVFVIAATTSYLLAYIIAHIDVIILRRRMPNHKRPYRTPFFPIPQILGIVAMVYVALHNSPSPDMTKMVYSIAGGMLAVICVIAAIWVKFYMKRKLFEPDMD
ncbi:Serine/threonine exchanger SteT [Marinomonas spartinae]|uniref:Serine/threonine exchanger SteT n=1 Tax=Marinomonas spartinae TaxID=1792290 RepID=A0A1A8T9Z3_9GAMM|nr:APC family permease [Marinomonas spartinae]SBS29325.1 Serine/threonine exchanger SteT [Marinomonas spartinae]SBS38606.1 Serine/threonine exchanger SteT [Marinomonas spartinae]